MKTVTRMCWGAHVLGCACTPKFWIWTSKIIPDIWLLVKCQLLSDQKIKIPSTLLGIGNSSTCRFVVHKNTVVTLYTVHSLARDCCCDTKVLLFKHYLSMNNSVVFNLDNLQKFTLLWCSYKNAVKITYFHLNAKSLIQKFVIHAILCKLCFSGTYSTDKRWCNFCLQILPTIFNLQKCYHPVSFMCSWSMPQYKIKRKK